MKTIKIHYSIHLQGCKDSIEVDFDEKVWDEMTDEEKEKELYEVLLEDGVFQWWYEEK